jgi:hypothetical protein
MTAFRVTQAEEVRQLPAKGDFPPSAVDHLTLEANGTEVLATAFRKLDTPLPAVGSMLEGELGDQDNFDKGRRKFKKARMGGGSGNQSAKDAYWERKEQRDIEAQPRIEFQSARRDAIHILDIKMRHGRIEDFDASDVGRIADKLMRLVDPPAPASDVPADTEGLPSAEAL